MFAERFDRSPIDNPDSLVRFIHTRSAYIAQTALYGYLKTRMGTRFRVIFEDDRFAPALNGAKWRIFAACLSDLSVFAVATIVRECGIDAGAAARLAAFCHGAAIDATFGECEIDGLAEDCRSRFRTRLGFVDWAQAARRENAFVVSPDALVEHAPVIDEFKELDREIVVNSIRFRWRDVRDQFRGRLDGPALLDAWSGTGD